MNATDDSPDLGFSHRVMKSGDVEVSHHGRVVTTLRGHDAAQFLAKVGSGSAQSAQQWMARVTGNYRRGNERLARQHPRNTR